MAVIVIDGGSSGIKEYLETGAMQGREQTRDELDQRLILEGDLDITNNIINSIEGDREKYKHVTISFKEAVITPEMMQSMAADFKEFAFASFGENELNFYAEAHIPKIQSYIDKNGETVYRHPHIHFVIPTVNLVTGERASPFEMLSVTYGKDQPQTLDFIDAFKEHINAKYGVASPRNNRRINSRSELEVIAARENKIDNTDFSGKTTKESLARIQERIIAERIETPEDFRAMLETMGEVKEAKSREFGDYLKVKLPGEEKYVRFDYQQFTKEFIALPTEEKQQLLNEARESLDALKYLESTQGKGTAERDEILMAGWPQRAREIRYIDCGSKFYIDTYSKATNEQKLEYLAALEQHEFTLMEKEYGYDHTTGTIGTPGVRHARDAAFEAIAGSISAATRNFTALEQRPGIDADALREHLARTRKATATLDHEGREHQGRSAQSDGRNQSGESLNGTRALHRDIENNLRAATNHYQLFEGDRASFSEAALANWANFNDALDAARYAAHTDKRLSRVYGRSTDDLRAAAVTGDNIIADPSQALAGLTFSQSLFTARELEAFVLKNTADHNQCNRALAAVMSHPDLVVRTTKEGKTVFTTAQIVKIEADLIARATKMAAHKCAAISEESQQQLIDKMTMNTGQEAAFKLLCSTDQLAVVNGFAGTGKSYILGAMREAYEEQGYTVHGAILQGKTASDLMRDSGIRSSTIHSFLSRIEKGQIKLNKKSVVVIDEAGMVGSAQMEKLLAHVEKAGGRIRLVGDAAQLAAVEYGNAFVEVSKLSRVAALTEIQRQKESWQREASLQFSEHNVDAGLTAYADRGFVHCSDTQSKAEDKIVAEWAADRRAAPHQTSLVLVSTNAERVSLNNKMRETLKDEGGLWDGVIVETGRGFREIATGEKLMFTKNDRELGTSNGTTGTVEKVAGSVLHVRLEDGKTVQLDARDSSLDIDYAYCVTIHKSQGMTVDKAWLLANPMMSAESVLVGCTRHRHELQIHYSSQHFPANEQLTIDPETGAHGAGGKLIKHGKAPFEFDPEGKPSYYAVVEVGGKEKTIWGVGLGDAIEASGAEVGNHITLGVTGKTDVAVTDYKTGESVTAKRNAWAVNVVEENGAELQAVQLASLKKHLGAAGRKEFTRDTEQPEWETTRTNDSVVAQVIAEHAAETYIERVSHTAYGKELNARMRADLMLAYVAKIKGVVIDRYTITKDEEGRDRIQCGKASRTVSDFLTKELKLDYQNEALPILKEVYAIQNEATYLTLRDHIANGEKFAHEIAAEGFKEHRELHVAAHTLALADLKAEAAQIKSQIEAEGLAAKNDAKANDPASLRAVIDDYDAKLKEHSAKYKDLEAQITEALKTPSSELYKDFLVEKHCVGNSDALVELQRIATTDADKLRVLSLTDPDAAEAFAVAMSVRAAERDAAAQESAKAAPKETKAKAPKAHEVDKAVFAEFAAHRTELKTQLAALKAEAKQIKAQLDAAGLAAKIDAKTNNPASLREVLQAHERQVETHTATYKAKIEAINTELKTSQADAYKAYLATVGTAAAQAELKRLAVPTTARKGGIRVKKAVVKEAQPKAPAQREDAAAWGEFQEHRAKHAVALKAQIVTLKAEAKQIKAQLDAAGLAAKIDAKTNNPASLREVLQAHERQVETHTAIYKAKIEAINTELRTPEADAYKHYLTTANTAAAQAERQRMAEKSAKAAQKPAPEKAATQEQPAQKMPVLEVAAPEAAPQKATAEKVSVQEKPAQELAETKTAAQEATAAKESEKEAAQVAALLEQEHKLEMETPCKSRGKGRGGR